METYNNLNSNVQEIIDYKIWNKCVKPIFDTYVLYELEEKLYKMELTPLDDCECDICGKLLSGYEFGKYHGETLCDNIECFENSEYSSLFE